MADDNTTTDSSFGSLFGGGQLPSIFGGNTPLTYEELQRRRAIALALASRQKGFPKNKGEGMTYLGESIGNALQGIGLDMAEKRYLAQQAAISGKPIDAAPIPVAPNGKPAVLSAPQKTSQAPAAVEPAPTTTADAAVTPASMAAATEPQDAPGGGVPDLSQFATAGLTAGDFGTPAPPPAESPFPASVASRFSAVNDVLPPAQRPVPPVSVDPNMRAQLSGGNNAIDPSTMAQPQLAAFARPSGSPVPAPGTPMPPPRPPMPRDLANATPEEGGFNAIDAGADLMTARKRSIGGIESGGAKDPYSLVTNTGRGDYVYGKYQVAGKEIPALTEKYLGKAMTPNQFKNNPEAQDAVFTGEFGTRLVGKYGEEGAARAWYAGERGMQNPNATDRFGRLTVRDYGRQYLAGLDPNAAPDGSGGGGGGSGGGVPAVAQGSPAGPGPGRDGIALAMLAQQAQQPQQASPEENAPDARLLEIAAGNTRRPGSPFRATASLDAGRAGVVSDAPQPGLSPMGSLDPTASINARRDAITGASMGQPPATVPGVPQPDPTQSGPTAPATSGVDLTGGSSNPPTVVDMAPAPPMGATAQAGVPLGGYPSVPQARAPQVPPGQLAPPPTSTIEPRPPAPQVGVEVAPRQLKEPVYPTMMPASPNELEAQKILSNPALAGTPALAARAKALADIGARQREQYNAELLDRYTRDKTAWDAQEAARREEATPKGQREAATGRLELQGKQYDADVKRWLGGQDVNTVYAGLDADKAEATKSNSLLRQAAIVREAINNGIITGLGADQKLNIAKLHAWMSKNPGAGDEASNTEMFKAAADAMLATGVETIRGGAGKVGLGNRVSPTELDIARGGVGADPTYQLSMIKKLIV
jgi:hypothetical protein